MIGSHLKIICKLNNILICVLLFLFQVDRSMATPISGNISRIGKATHIEFTGRQTWNYKIEKKSETIYVLSVPQFDDKTVLRFKTWEEDGLIKSIGVNKQDLDNQYEIIFTLANANVDSFDYLTDQPSRLIIDFFIKEAASISSEKVEPKPIQVSKTKSVKKEKRKASIKKIYKKKSRKLAGEILQSDGSGGEPAHPQQTLVAQYGVFDGSDPDYKRFRMHKYEVKKESIMANRQHIFLKFPMLIMSDLDKTQVNSPYFNITQPALRNLIQTTPEFIINPKPNKENKEARLLLTLFKKNRVVSFLKAYQYFIKQYPKSEYDEIVRNLAAEVYYKRWKRDNNIDDIQQAQKIYLKLVSKYPESVLTERTELLLAYTSDLRGRSIEAIQKFNAYLKKYGNSEYSDHVKKSLAQSYLNINKYKQALDTLDNLEENYQNKISLIEAVYRKGDVYFKEHQYNKSVTAYDNAIKKYPEYVRSFPNAYYNRSEALFWLGQYYESLNGFVNFFEAFPNHKYGGYGMTRVGELLEILGAEEKKVIGAYLESYFRYKKNPGAEVARIRLLTKRFKYMKDKERERSLEEMQTLAKSTKLPRMNEFAILMEAKSLHSIQEYKKAYGQLIAYYQKNPTSIKTKFFKKRITSIIADEIKDKLAANKFIYVLNIYDEFSETWLKNTTRYDIPFFLARAYEQGGAFFEAEALYEKSLKDIIDLEGRQERFIRKRVEHLPTSNDIRLRLAHVAMNKRKYREAQGYLNDITKVKDFSDQQIIEVAEISAKIAEEMGAVKLAKAKLKKLLLNSLKDKKNIYPIYYRLASVEIQLREYLAAEESLSKIEAIRIKDKSMIPDNLWADTLQLKGHVLELQGKSVEAIEVYTQLLIQFENKRPLDSVRYKVGMILFNQDDIKGAEKVWNALNQEKSALYVKLSKERLDSAKWQDDYKKYLNRIPAAKDIR